MYYSTKYNNIINDFIDFIDANKLINTAYYSNQF